MTISEQILAEVRRMKDEGYTQSSIAKKLNVSQQMICLMLNGQRPTGRLRLETVDRMFPNGILNMNGGGGDVTIQSNNNISITTGDSALLDQVMQDIMTDEVMDDKSKVRAYSILIKYKGNRNGNTQNR